MAIAYVQKVASGLNGASSTTCTASVTATATPGNFLVVVVSTNGAAGDDCSMSDNSTQPGAANNWQLIYKLGQNQGGNTAIHVFSCIPTRRLLSGTDTITATFSVAASRSSVIVNEYSGLISPIMTARTQVGGTATTIASQTTTNRYKKNALMINAVSNNTGSTTGQTTTGATNGFNLRLGANNSGGGTVTKEATILDKVVSVVGGSQTSPTDVSTVGWLSVMLSFEDAFDINYRNPRGRYST